jgi:hypothetical protein
MSIQKFLGKLEGSPIYKDFKKEHKNNYLTAGFFVIDKETGKDVHQLDFYLPNEKKMAAFTLGKEITLQILNLVTDKIPEKLDTKSKIDLDAISGIIQDEMKNRTITGDIKKVIAVLQTLDGKKIWNVSCILSGMDLLRVHVEDDSETVLKMDRSSLMDMIKTVPKSELMKMRGKQEGKAPSGKADEKALMKENLDKLNKLESQIEKEKAVLEKELNKPEKPAKKADKKK